MINVKDLPVDVEEMRLWLNGYRELSDPPMPWSQLAREASIPLGTITTFAAGTYGAKDGGGNVARKVFQFRQSVEAQSMRQGKLPVNPGYFDTRTSLRMMELLEIAHGGRITVIGTSAQVSARVVKDGTTHPVDMVADILAEVGLEAVIHQDSFALAKSLTPEYAIGISFENFTAAQAIREIVRRCLYDLWIDFGEIKIRAYLGED
jgi:hypothetical protein